MKIAKAYIVTTEGDCEGKSPEKVIGYAMGERTLVEEFLRDKYKDRIEYSLRLREIEIPQITTEAVFEQKKLLAEKADLEKRLKNIGIEMRGQK